MPIDSLWGKNPLTILTAKRALSCEGCRHYDILWGIEKCSHKDNRGRQPIRCINYERGVNDKK